MSPRGKGRWILWIFGAGAFAALAGIGVSWKSLVMRHYLKQLRRDPTALPSYLDAPDGTVKKLAANAFAREPLGMVSQFVDCFEKARARRIGGSTHMVGKPGTLGEVDRAIMGFRGGSHVRGKWMFWSELRWPGALLNGLFDTSDPAHVELAERLAECYGPSIDLPHYPGLRVEVLPLESALDRTTQWTEAWGGQPWRGPPGVHGSWAPVDGSKRPQESVLLFSRIPQ